MAKRTGCLSGLGLMVIFEGRRRAVNGDSEVCEKLFPETEQMVVASARCDADIPSFSTTFAMEVKSLPIYLMMKYPVLFVIWLLFLSGTASPGQSILGISGGYLNAGYFDRSDAPHYSANYESPLTYCASAILKQRNHANLNAGVAVSFVNRELGLKAHYGGLGSQTEVIDHYNLNYLYLSVFPEVSYGDRFRFNFSIGPALGFLVHSHMNSIADTYSGTGVDSVVLYDGNAASRFEGLEVRLTGNIGFELLIGSKFRITLDNSYSRGITSSASDGWSSYAEFVSTYDMSLMLGLAYTLDKFSFRLLPKPRTHE